MTLTLLKYTLSLGAFIGCWFGSANGWAAVERFAVIIGNNRGTETDVELRYAESDALKIYDVLRELGDFSAPNTTLLRGADADTVRSSLIAVNERVRSAQRGPGDQTLLVVYYSGHSDAEALHLGSSRLKLQELGQLVRGSAATFRLLIVDACRSGALTRVKGGTVIAPFALHTEPRLHGQGVAFLTASSANEDAQESDELRGSFFTHAFVSGLLGAADSDGDGAVALEEAYRHARSATIRATSRTFAGTQHPTFQYDVRGQDSLILTRPGAAHQRSILTFPAGLNFLLIAQNEQGPVVAEVASRDVGRHINVPPGRYLVRGRASSYLLEGSVVVSPGENRLISLDELERVEYARLVRKGGSDLEFSHAVHVGATWRTRLANSSTPCFGLELGYQLDLSDLSFLSRVSGCWAELRTPVLSADVRDYSLQVGIARMWDTAGFSLGIGALLGASLTQQSFTTNGVAPDRWTASPMGSVELAGLFTGFAPYFAGVQGQGQVVLLHFQETALAEPSLRYSPAIRAGIVLGRQF